MKFRRCVCLMLSLLLLAGLFAGCSNSHGGDDLPAVRTEAPLAPMPEGNALSTDAYERALCYGFLPENFPQEAGEFVSVKQFCEALSNIVSLVAPDGVEGWRQDAAIALQSDDPIYSDEALVAIYLAACNMGFGQTSVTDWSTLGSVCMDWESDDNTAAYFPACEDPAIFCDIYNLIEQRPCGWSNTAAANKWMFGQRSTVDGQLILDHPELPGEVPPLRKLDGVLAAETLARFYESTFEATVPTGPSDEAQALLLAADERREAILNSPTTIVKSDAYTQGETYTGTAYYVSNDGDDHNSGTNAETPWKTLDKVNQAGLDYGDAVFFRRGDTWYGELLCKAGVTYSAYGEGEKPLFSGSSPEASSPDAWTLCFEGNNGEKIWTFHRETPDIAGIFFNGGSQWAEKVVACWNGEQYVTKNGDPFIPEKQLSQNRTFFSGTDLTGLGIDVDLNGISRLGQLYLRCDEGNPAQVYDSVDLTLVHCGAEPAEHNGSGVTIDNLSFRYYSDLGISCSGYQGWTGIHIQYCELSHCGGNIGTYDGSNASERGISYPQASGGTIQLSGSQNTALNNYIHHSWNAFILSIHNRECGSTFSDLNIRGNLIENGTTALHVADYMPMDTGGEQEGYFENLCFEDNMVFHVGESWVADVSEKTDIWAEKTDLCSIEFGGKLSVNPNSGIYIRNNVFYSAKEALVHCYMPEEYFPIFDGNTYAQNQNGWLAFVRGRGAAITVGGQEAAKEFLGDANASVVVLS